MILQSEKSTQNTYTQKKQKKTLNNRLKKTRKAKLSFQLFLFSVRNTTIKTGK